MRYYTKNTDLSKLPAHEQPKVERNTEVANLWAQGLSPQEILVEINKRFTPPITRDRIYQILRSWKPVAEKGDK